MHAHFYVRHCIYLCPSDCCNFLQLQMIAIPIDTNIAPVLRITIEDVLPLSPQIVTRDLVLVPQTTTTNVPEAEHHSLTTFPTYAATRLTS